MVKYVIGPDVAILLARDEAAARLALPVTPRDGEAGSPRG
jgi:hypothetical protein